MMIPHSAPPGGGLITGRHKQMAGRRQSVCWEHVWERANSVVSSRHETGSADVSSAPSGRVGAIVVAAGSSTRMGQVDKVFAPLMGRPLFSYSVDALERCQLIERVVVVLGEQVIEKGWEAVRRFGWNKVSIVAGGHRRQDSVRAGLPLLSDTDWIVVHDGARPCVTSQMIERGLSEAIRTGAAVAAVPVKDTVKVVDVDMTVVQTPDRARLWLVQTPQVFSRDLLVRAHSEVAQDVTDDASMVEQVGGSVRIFQGSYANVKVTTPEDLEIAEHLLSRGTAGENAQPHGAAGE